MHLNSVGLCTLITALQLISLSTACVPTIRSPDNSSQNQTYPWAKLGSDAPADSQTTGYFINHFSINVRNLTRSIDFYTQVFGLRHIFTFQISPHVSIAYLGHSHGGKNGTGYQTALEMNRQKNNIEGLIEFVFVDVPNQHLPGSTKVTNTFSHIGIVVPDLAAAQNRMDTYGVNIFKRFGETIPRDHEITRTSSFNDIFKLDEAEQKLAWAGLDLIQKPIIFALDPDDNLIEVQPAEGAALT